MWNTIASDIEKLKHDTLLLRALEKLIVAGLSSRRRGIVNITLHLWNKTFGQQETLDLPSALEIALQRLATTAEVLLPQDICINDEQV